MLYFFIHWNIKPELFTIGSWSPRWYGLFFALAFVCGYYIMLKFFKKDGVKQEVLDSLTVYMFLGTLIGARLGHCLFYEPAYYLSHPIKILMVWQGGLASHGAAVGILIAIYFFVKKFKKPYLWIFDRIGVVTALGGFFIRSGNLMNSEIVGKQTDVPWGFIFERLHENFPRHPSQLYEALAYLLIFFILYYLFTKTKYGQLQGYIFGLFLVLIFGFRFFIEFTKEVQVEFEKGMSLNMGQWLSIPFVLIGLFLMFRASAKQVKATTDK